MRSNFKGEIMSELTFVPDLYTRMDYTILVNGNNEGSCSQDGLDAIREHINHSNNKKKIEVLEDMLKELKD